MNVEQATVGQRVRSLVAFVGVPSGTEGVIDEVYETGVMVAWDLPKYPLPDGYTKHDGTPTIKSGILRDGFAVSEFAYLRQSDE